MLFRTFASQLAMLAAAFLMSALGGPRAGAAALPPIAQFFDNPLLADAKLSPSGRYLAAISGAPGRRDYLVVIDLEAQSAKLVAGYSDIDILHFDWVNDKRLVYDMLDKRLAYADQYASVGLFAVDRDGGNPRELAHRRGGPARDLVENQLRGEKLPWNVFMLRQRGAQDSDAIYVTNVTYDREGEVVAVHLLKLDTLTRSYRAVPAPRRVSGWMLDHKGEPRLAWSRTQGVTTLHYLDPANNAWRKLTSFDSYQGGAKAFTPVGFGSDGRLFVEANKGRDTTALYTLDLATGEVGDTPVYASPTYDFDGELIGTSMKTLGVRIQADTPGVAWFDAESAALQRKLDAALPDTANLMSFASGGQAQWALVRAYSDKKPTVYYLFHLKTGELNRVGATHPAIDPARMGRQDVVRYKARDGLEIPALLTLPAGGAKNAPLVVLVHGGPYVRGSRWGWDPETQFLASRGYAVLEPEFRGSTGHGARHFRAGWKQWGLAMQDDIADGARWAIAQGIADPKRICIAGASYGGYATLMGLVNDPDLYKCGINWVGVTDINLLYDGHWTQHSDLSEQWKQYGMPALVGDQVKDAAQLQATSPLVQAARIKAPLLLAYGGADERVPIYHGRKFLAAVKPHNQQVEWIDYVDEGHGWGLPATRVDFWGRVEKFLDKHIGSGAAAN